MSCVPLGPTLLSALELDAEAVYLGREAALCRADPASEPPQFVGGSLKKLHLSRSHPCDRLCPLDAQPSASYAVERKLPSGCGSPKRMSADAKEAGRLGESRKLRDRLRVRFCHHRAERIPSSLVI